MITRDTRIAMAYIPTANYDGCSRFQNTTPERMFFSLANRRSESEYYQITYPRICIEYAIEHYWHVLVKKDVVSKNDNVLDEIRPYRGRNFMSIITRATTAKTLSKNLKFLNEFEKLNDLKPTTIKVVNLTGFDPDVKDHMHIGTYVSRSYYSKVNHKCLLVSFDEDWLHSNITYSAYLRMLRKLGEQGYPNFEHAIYNMKVGFSGGNRLPKHFSDFFIRDMIRAFELSCHTVIKRMHKKNLTALYPNNFGAEGFTYTIGQWAVTSHWLRSYGSVNFCIDLAYVNKKAGHESANFYKNQLFKFTKFNKASLHE